MKFTEIQRKLHQLLNEYEAAVIAENRGRNRSCYNEIENKYYQKRMELKEFVAELEAEVTKCHELQDSYCDRIAELEAEQRWIPVSEGLPETDGQYIGYTNTGLVGTHWLVDGHFVVTYSCEQKWLTTPTSWILESASGGDVYVTHWMPLPTPPEVQE